VNGVTTTSRALLAAWLGVVVLGLTGCGGDDDEPGGTGSTSASPTASDTVSQSADPSTDPTETPTDTGSPSPTVAPATGIELREQTSSIRLPEGWRATDPISTTQSSAIGPDGAGSITLLDDDTLNPGFPLEERVKIAIQTLPDGAKHTRLPDVMLGDTPAYHLTYTMPGRTEVHDLVEGERSQRLVTVDFALSAKALKQDPEIVATVLATFQWVG